MIGYMIDYLKAVWANKITLVGYGFLFLGASQFDVEMNSLEKVLFWSGGGVGGILLGLSLSATGTRKTYRRTKEHITDFGRLYERYIKKYPRYCDRKGVELAAREAGIEYLVKS